MLQLILAIIIIGFFIAKLFSQKAKNQITKNEFIFWLLFWFVSLILVASLKWLDRLVAELGFSASGIQVLLYLAVAVFTYLIFRIRLRLSKMEKNITKIIEHLALKNK